MINHCMSYNELYHFIENLSSEEANLDKYQLNSIKQSLKEEFLRELLSQYPYADSCMNFLFRQGFNECGKERILEQKKSLAEEFFSELRSRYSYVDSFMKFLSTQGFYECDEEATLDLKSFIESITKPFIIYTPEMRGNNIRPKPSKILCDIYYQSIAAAGINSETAEDEEIIISAMLKYGPFIDRNHLETILVIQKNEGLFTQIKNAFGANFELSDKSVIPHKANFVRLYQEYLRDKNGFYPFYDESALTQVFLPNSTDTNQHQKRDRVNINNRKSYQYLCYENVFEQWLLNHSNYFRNKEHFDLYKRIAILCAQVGYLKGFKTLYTFISEKEGPLKEEILKLCLEEACDFGHNHLVSYLLNLEVSIVLNSRALEYASCNNYTDIIELLIASGADVNVLDSCWDVYRTDFHTIKLATVELLILSGARVTNIRGLVSTIVSEALDDSDSSLRKEAEKLLLFWSPCNHIFKNYNNALYNFSRCFAEAKGYENILNILPELKLPDLNQNPVTQHVLFSTTPSDKSNQCIVEKKIK